MHGNVWEWCADWHGDYSGYAVGPTVPASGVVRLAGISHGLTDIVEDAGAFDSSGNHVGMETATLVQQDGLWYYALVEPLSIAKIVLRVVPGYAAWLVNGAKEELFNQLYATAMKKTKSLIYAIIFLSILPIGLFLFLRPTAAERSHGNYAHFQVWRTMDDALIAAELSPQKFAEERAQSYEWISSPWMCAFERHVHNITIPAMSVAMWSLSRVMDDKLPPINGFLSKIFFTTLVVFSVAFLTLIYAVVLTSPHRMFVRSDTGPAALAASVVMGFLCGVGVLLQEIFSWFLIPAVLFFVAVIVALFCIYNVINDIFRAKFWSLLTLVSLPFGLLSGIFFAVCLEFLLGIIFLGIVFGVVFFLITRLSHCCAYGTGKKGKLSNGKEIEQLTDGTWRDEDGHGWRMSGFNTVQRDDSLD